MTGNEAWDASTYLFLGVIAQCVEINTLLRPFSLGLGKNDPYQ